jgi:hypothetical protein
MEYDKYGFEVGSLRSQAAALYEKGATRVQVKEVCGTNMLNVLELVREKGYKVKVQRVRVGKNRPHFKYTIMPKDSNNEEVTSNSVASSFL